VYHYTYELRWPHHDVAVCSLYWYLASKERQAQLSRDEPDDRLYQEIVCGMTDKARDLLGRGPIEFAAGLEWVMANRLEDSLFKKRSLPFMRPVLITKIDQIWERAKFADRRLRKSMVGQFQKQGTYVWMVPENWKA
jgi:hypothetical protein